MDDKTSQSPQQQLVDRLKTATNILVTVSTNPSVDQLAACIGLTLVLNKLNKHATAVFSGEVPSIIEFLKPQDTLEKNTNSLRDFIIALDKSKADKLRYKVEDKVVKIFITPYRTSLSADDLEFSQGDFNVDVVIALGVEKQEDLDNAITAHGRILHDATVASVNTTEAGGLGNINWHDAQASSLCELVVDLTKQLGDNLLDGQVATALLTGVVAETDRFSNDKTTPQTMSVSAELMSNGADQQLVASKLEGPVTNVRADKSAKDSKPDAGTVEISHPKEKDDTKKSETESPAETTTESLAEEPEEVEPKDIFAGTDEIDESSHVSNPDKAPKFVDEAPSRGGTLTANSAPEPYDPSTDPLSLPKVDDQAVLSHDVSPAEPSAPTSTPPSPSAPTSTFSPPPFSWTPPSFVANSPAPSTPANPVSEEVAAPVAPVAAEPPSTGVEEPISSELTSDEPGPETGHVDAARDEVAKALSSMPPSPEPVQALNAQPIDLQPPEPTEPAPPPPAQPSTAFDPSAFGIMNDPTVSAEPTSPAAFGSVNDQATPQSPTQPAPDFSSPLGQSLTMPLPPSAPPIPPAQPVVNDPTAPPPVPPPLPFQFGNTPGQNKQ